MNDGQALKEYLNTNNVDISYLATKLNKSRAMIYIHMGKPSLKDSVKEMYTNHFGVNFFIDSVKNTQNLTRNENITDKNLSLVKDENEAIANINQSAKNEVKQGLKFADSGKVWEYSSLPKPIIEAKPISLHPHNDDDDSGTAKYVFAPDGTMGMRVPIVPVKAQAGYLLGFADPEFYEDFETEIIPVYQEHKGTYLGFEVKGDSMMTTDPEQMENNIYPGWRAIGKDLPKSKWAYKLHTHKYDYWIIVHRTEGILIKAITKHDVANGVITIHSLNPAYEDKDLHLSDIEQIFNVVQIVPKKRR